MAKETLRKATAWFFHNFGRNFRQVTVHPLFSKLQIDVKSFDVRGHKSTFQGHTHEVGNPTKKYYQPMADQHWERFGLNVMNKFDDGNNAWLAPFKNPGMWWRAYHGTSSTGLAGIAAQAGTQNAMRESKKGKLGPGVYVTPHIEYALTYSGGAKIKLADGSTRRYQMIFHCAVKPGMDTIRAEGYPWYGKMKSGKWSQHNDGGKSLFDLCSSRYDVAENSEWVFKTEHVRPYGVLLANAEHLEELFGLPNGGLANLYGHKELTYTLTADDMEPEPAST